MKIWWKRTDYRPTVGQWPIHKSPARFKLIAGGERAGKSRTAASYALPRIPDTTLLWIVAKDYNLARPEFQYLFDDLNPLGFIRKSSMPQGPHSPWVMTLVTGTEIRTITAADEVKLAARAPDGIIMAEAAQQSYEIYLRLRRRTAEKRGWLLLEGTFESSEDWYAELWEKWLNGGPTGEQSFSLPSWSNNWKFPGGRNDPELLQQLLVMGEEAFNERFGGVPTPPRNLVHPEFSFERNVGYVQFDREKPVELAIDPGYNGAYAVIALQWYGGVVHVIDEVYERRKDARSVIKICKSRPWWGSINRENGGVIDTAANQHQGMESHVEIWAKYAGISLASVYVPIEDGIERVRSFIRDPDTGNPKLLYDAEKTPNAQAEYRKYKYPVDKEGKKQGEKPIDRDNHAVKALAYWLVARFGWAKGKRNRQLNLRYGEVRHDAQANRRIKHRSPRRFTTFRVQ